MAETHETHAAVIAEMRERKSQLEDAIFNAPLCYSTDDMRAKVEVLDEFIDRLEAAHRREITTLELGVSSAHDALREVIEQNCSHCHKRELAASGNAAKLREAAVTAYDVLEKLKPFSLLLGDVGRMREFNHLICLAKNRLDAALSAPPRNCEVGTPEEQAKRFNDLCHGVKCSECRAHFTPEHKTEAIHFGRVYCVTKWAQMPYEAEKGGAE